MAGINIDELILKKRIIVLEKENERLKEKYNKRLKMFCDMYNLLQDENNELYKINKANAKSYEKFWYKLEKYKNCISKIKRNIDSYCYGCRGYEPNKNCSYCNYKLILKKIKEVEDERI